MNAAAGVTNPARILAFLNLFEADNISWWVKLLSNITSVLRDVNNHYLTEKSFFCIFIHVFGYCVFGKTSIGCFELNTHWLVLNWHERETKKHVISLIPGHFLLL